MNISRRRLLAGASLAALGLGIRPAGAVLGKLGAGMMGQLGAGGALGAKLNLSQTQFAREQASGLTIGTLSVTRGTGAYTYTLTSNPGTLFAISGSNLNTNSATIDTGSYPVTIQANNGAGSIITQSYTLIALSEAIPFVF